MGEKYFRCATTTPFSFHVENSRRLLPSLKFFEIRPYFSKIASNTAASIPRFADAPLSEVCCQKRR